MNTYVIIIMVVDPFRLPQCSYEPVIYVFFSFSAGTDFRSTGQWSLHHTKLVGLRQISVSSVDVFTRLTFTMAPVELPIAEEADYSTT